MVYSEFQGLRLSMLGFGTMRLPTKGKDNEIDEAQAQQMFDYAMANGVNYYDTAWGYHGGMSEIVTGKCLKKYPRGSFYLASKFPGYDLSNMDKVKTIFEKQLEKCGVDYFDFYLVHNVCELNIDEYLNPAHGIYEYLTEQKRNGRIKHLGFSAHGSVEVIRRFLDVYGKDMEFCQLQLNYLDWTFQNDKEKVGLVSSLGIPVWVMEPLRGGRLCRLNDEQNAMIDSLRSGCTSTEWAFRYLQSIPQVKVILSGMSDFEQMKQNVKTFETYAPLDEKELDATYKMADEMLKIKTLPCTACHYCTSHCPMELDIPTMISFYNENEFSGGGFLAPMAIAALDDDKKPSACLACGSCEAVCPQQIKISDMMSDFAHKLGLN